MPAFDYVAVDSSGKQVKGSLEGADVQQVRDALKNQGLTPMDVRAQSIFSKEITIGGSGVKPKDLSVMCKQFASILTAGVTIVQSLDMISGQTENKALKKALEEAKVAVEKGETLANGFRLNEKIFPPMLINMVAAGEASGSLEIAFERMASQFEKSAKLKSMMTSAMIYPIAILVVMVIVLIVMLVVVIPQFEEMFASMDTELPAITKAVVAMSKGLMKNWYIVLGIVIAIVVGIKVFLATDAGDLLYAKMMLSLPLFGDLTVKSASASLCRTLSTLMAAGLSLVDSIDIVARTQNNRIVKETLYQAKEEVLLGTPLSKPLEASGIFPRMVYQMLKIGEETGNQEEMLDKVADFYEEEVEIATKNLTTAMEPMIIIIMAIMVGGVMAAVMSPMMSMYSAAENA